MQQSKLKISSGFLLEINQFFRHREVNIRRLRFGELYGSENRLRLLCLHSDRLVCMRRTATPPSSVVKSNPRCTERIPVDMSVRLTQRTDCALRKFNDKLSTLEQAIDARDMCEDGRHCENDA
jgi:hypothetical protein